MIKSLVILGTTSTGKTDLALSLAKEFGGELVACDSRQVYKGLDVGTGKRPSGVSGIKGQGSRIKKYTGYWEINGVKVWMYDVVDLKKQYSVTDYVKDASRVIDEITARGKLPIVVGGTGLYLRALLDGLPSLAVPLDLKLRKKLENLSLEELQKKLKEISPQRWEKMNNSDRQNPRRLVRAIEIVLTVTSDESLRATVRGGLQTLKIGLNAPREVLYQRINEQVIRWVKDGIVPEVKRLIEKGISKQRIQNLGLEYRVGVEYLDNPNEEMIEKMQNKVRQYSKRQNTWFKKEKDVVWFDVADKSFLIKIANRVAKWYDSLKYNDSKN